MDISFMLGIAAFGITGTVIAVFLKESRLPVFALLAALATAVTVLIQLLPEIRRLWEGFSRLSQLTGVNSDYAALILKIIAFAYVAEFGAQLCRDAGQGAIAMKIELAARVGVIMLAFPVITAVVDTVLGLLS